MKRIIFLLVCLAFSCEETSQSELSNKTNTSTYYSISFDNAIHHEANVEATFTNLKEGLAEIRMARTSPGRYALHEFIKNVYNVKFTDDKGNNLEAIKEDPYSWQIKHHNGTIKVTYTLFANRGDGTYSQIDETHAHLNIPATFIYAPQLKDDKIEVVFNVRKDLNWKVASQLKHESGTTFSAPDFNYFMDSPTELSNHSIRSFEVDGKSINFVLHHEGTEEEFDEYFESVKKVVLQQKTVFGELPDFDFNSYTFLACYLPNVDGDGMEHRNSTILTSKRSLGNGGMKRNLGTVSHEFFHAWNVERIRPRSLEPFDFENADMSGELWFAEGFTSYYTGLILVRAGLISEKEYVNSLTNTINAVWNSPGRRFYNPIEMSYQAPFVDAARSVDPNNRGNTFISYYTYGSALGLALDLSLRVKQLSLDDFMLKVWHEYGKSETPYTISDLNKVLNEYAGNDFGNEFFNNYIYQSNMPDMKFLLSKMGINMNIDVNKAYFGVNVINQIIAGYPRLDSPAYKLKMDQGDKIIKFGEDLIDQNTNFISILENYKAGDEVEIVYERYGAQKKGKLKFPEFTGYSISLMENENDQQKAMRESWLSNKE